MSYGKKLKHVDRSFISLLCVIIAFDSDNKNTLILSYLTMHAFNRQTDGRTDRQTDKILIARPRTCIPCSAVKMFPYLTALFVLF